MENHRRFIVTFLLLTSLLAPECLAQKAADLQPQASKLAGAIMVGGRSMDYLKELTDKFGGRLTGTSSYKRSAEWAADQFRIAGISNVKLEPFTIPNGWDRGQGRGRIISPVERPLHIESLGWAPATPAGGVKGEILIVADLGADKLKAQADKIKGRIVKLDLSALFAEGIGAFGKLIAAIPIFKEHGALAVVVSDSESNNVLNAFGFTWGASLSALPLAQIGMEDGILITRLMEKGPVTIEFEYQNKTSGPVEVNNVVAEIRGREKPDEWIIVGAHLDSWDYGTGAQDNGTGCAMVLEAARAIRAMGTAPRRSIRFALWGGEEQGLLGSAAYVRAHAQELDRCVAALNTDNGAGHPRGWKVEGRKDVNDAVEEISRALLTELSGGSVSMQTTFDTDHGHFMLAGIPSLDLWVDMEGYGKVHHKSSDTVDKVDSHNLAADSAIVAITAYSIAEKSDRIAPHIDHAQVGELLKKANLDAFLKTVGVWN